MHFRKGRSISAALPLLQSSNQWAMMQEKRLICTGGRTAPAKECAYDLFACIPDARPGGRRGILLRSPEPADLLYRQRALSCIPSLPSAAKTPPSPFPKRAGSSPATMSSATCRTSAAHQRRHRRRPGPASGRRWTMCGSAGRSFGSGRQTSAPPENAPQSGRKVFWTAGQRNFFWRRCHAVARHL